MISPERTRSTFAASAGAVSSTSPGAAAAASTALWLALRWIQARGFAGSNRYLLTGSYFALLAISGVASWLMPIGSVLLLLLSTRRLHQSF